MDFEYTSIISGLCDNKIVKLLLVSSFILFKVFKYSIFLFLDFINDMSFIPINEISSFPIFIFSYWLFKTFTPLFISSSINAIRNACKNLDTFDLSRCELYTSAYPCPMCLGAIMWSNIKTVYYGATAQDTGNIGFRDDFMYDWINHKNDEILKLIEINREECVEVQQMWLNKKDRIEY